MKDFVLGRARTVLRAGSNDAFRGEPLQHFGCLALVDGGITGEVVYAVRDLRSRRGDEEVVHGGGRAFLTGRECCHRALEMVFDDSFCATELP